MNIAIEFILQHSNLVQTINSDDTNWIFPPPPKSVLLPNPLGPHIQRPSLIKNIPCKEAEADFTGTVDEWKNMIVCRYIPIFKELEKQKPNPVAFLKETAHYDALVDLSHGDCCHLEYIADYLEFPDKLLKPLQELRYTSKYRQTYAPFNLMDYDYIRPPSEINEGHCIHGRCYETGPLTFIKWNSNDKKDETTLWAYLGVKDLIDIELYENIEEWAYEYEASILITTLALGGHLELIKWARSFPDKYVPSRYIHDEPHNVSINRWGDYTYAAAAVRGHVHVLKYLKDNGCPFPNHKGCSESCEAYPTDTTQLLALYGFWDELKWAVDYGFPLEMEIRDINDNIVHNNAANYAVLHDRMDMLLWLLDRGCVLTYEAYKYTRSVEMLNFLLNKGVEQYDSRFGTNMFHVCIGSAAAEGKLDIVQEYHKMGNPIDSDLIYNAYYYKQYDILRWIFNNTTPVKTGRGDNFRIQSQIDECPIDILRKVLPFMEFDQQIANQKMTEIILLTLYSTMSVDEAISRLVIFQENGFLLPIHNIHKLLLDTDKSMESGCFGITYPKLVLHNDKLTQLINWIDSVPAKYRTESGLYDTYTLSNLQTMIYWKDKYDNY